MNELVRIDPIDLIEGMMKGVLRPTYESAYRRQSNGWTGSVPVDIAENDTGYLLWADLPGVRKEDVTVAINGRELTLSAEFKRENAVDQGQGREQFLRAERPYGNVTRTIAFPVELDSAKARAEYRDGVLQLTLPKQESAQVKRLTIH